MAGSLCKKAMDSIGGALVSRFAFSHGNARSLSRARLSANFAQLLLLNYPFNRYIYLNERHPSFAARLGG
jgi:hypothetical protein